MSTKYILILFSFIVAYSTSCHFENESAVNVPEGFPPLHIPANNQLSSKKIKLGERLFNDVNISIDSTIMCASCHKRDLAFADSVSISPGVDQRLGDRNSPSLINAAFSPLINKDGGVTKLDIQALIPIEDHNEMGISILELSKRLSDDEEYKKLFQQAFDREPDGFTIPRAFSSYVRSLVDNSSSYDKYLAGDSSALSSAAKRGMKLFFSDELACGKCHTGALLTNFEFANNGLYEEYNDLGRALITLDSLDHGKFRIPSLRNVSLTAPYMHDGSVATLDQVIDHYISGGSTHANKSDFIRGFEISEQNRRDLARFFNSLSSKKLASL